MAKATIQVNELGAWRNVATFALVSPENTRRIREALAGLAIALGPRPTWRIVDDSGRQLVWLNDRAIREGAITNG